MTRTAITMRAPQYHGADFHIAAGLPGRGGMGKDLPDWAGGGNAGSGAVGDGIGSPCGGAGFFTTGMNSVVSSPHLGQTTTLPALDESNSR